MVPSLSRIPLPTLTLSIIALPPNTFQPKWLVVMETNNELIESMNCSKPVSSYPKINHTPHKARKSLKKRQIWADQNGEIARFNNIDAHDLFVPVPRYHTCSSPLLLIQINKCNHTLWKLTRQIYQTEPFLTCIFNAGQKNTSMTSLLNTDRRVLWASGHWR